MTMVDRIEERDSVRLTGRKHPMTNSLVFGDLVTSRDDERLNRGIKYLGEVRRRDHFTQQCNI